MWSFLGSAGAFLLLVLVLGFWQHRSRKRLNDTAQKVDQEIQRAAEIVQRRHVQRYGREDTGLNQALAAPIVKLPKTKVQS